MGKDESILQAAAKEYGLDAKKDMWRLPALFVGQYAERDAESTLKLWKRLETEYIKKSCGIYLIWKQNYFLVQLI